MRIKGDLTVLALLFFICLAVRGVSQTLSASYLDSLDYEELLTEFNNYPNDSITQEIIARAYLNRAKLDRDTIKMARGYDRLARVFHPEKNIQFADSVILLTQEYNNITYPAMGYILKGYNYSIKRDVVNSNYNFIRAYQISKDRENLQQQVYILDILISDKLIWGNKKEALEMQYRRDRLIRTNEFLEDLKRTSRPEGDFKIDQLYLNRKINSNISFVFCHLTLKNIDSTLYYVERGNKLLEGYEWVNKEHYANWLEEVLIEVHTELGNSELVEEMSKDLLVKEGMSRHSLLNIFHRYGTSEINRGNLDVGYKLLFKSDSILSLDESLLLPSDRDLLVQLKDYYKKKGDLNAQIEYLSRLIRADSMMQLKYKYFEPNVIRSFETPNLVEEKEMVISQLENKNTRTKFFNAITIILLIICSFGLVYYFQRQKSYRRRFVKIVDELKNPSRNHVHDYSYKVSKNVINNILSSLEEFEDEKGFLDHNLSLHSLASRFETNPNYLSRVINAKIGKNFSRYINDLRIDYAMKYLLSDPRMRKYTIKAIAEECGYKSGESFSKAFYKQNGIYPSYYIKQLEKNESGINSKS